MSKEGKITGPVINGIRVDLPTHQADYELHNKVVRKTADQSRTSSTTLVDDDDLLLAIGANEVWSFEFRIFHVGHATPDIKFAITVPSGATLNWTANHINASNTHVNSQQVTSGGSVHFVSATTTRLDVITVIVENGATAGNIQFQFAQQASDGNTVTIKQESCLIATKLA